MINTDLIPRRKALAAMFGAALLGRAVQAEEPKAKVDIKALHLKKDGLLGADFKREDVFRENSKSYLHSYSDLLDEDFVALAKKHKEGIAEARKLLDSLKGKTAEVMDKLNKDFLPKDEQLKPGAEGYFKAQFFLESRIRDYSTRLAILQKLSNEGNEEILSKFLKP